MKIFFLFLLAMVNILFAQSVDGFLKNKLYIVQSGKTYFDSSLNEIMRRTWDISEIGGIVTRKEYSELCKDADKSFLNPSEATWDIAGFQNGRRSAPGLYCYTGGKKNPGISDAVTMIHFGGYVGGNYDSAVFRLELMVRNIMSTLKYSQKADSLSAIYKLSLLANSKILLINIRDTHESRHVLPLIPVRNMAGYPFKYEFALPEQIAQYIREKSNKYFLITPVLNDMDMGSKIYDVETGIYVGEVSKKKKRTVPLSRKGIEDFVALIQGVEMR